MLYIPLLGPLSSLEGTETNNQQKQTKQTLKFSCKQTNFIWLDASRHVFFFCIFIGPSFLLHMSRVAYVNFFLI